METRSEAKKCVVQDQRVSFIKTALEIRNYGHCQCCEIHYSFFYIYLLIYLFIYICMHDTV
jgi:hypothetical protein